MTNRIDSTNCTHDAALARIAELESRLDECRESCARAVAARDVATARLDSLSDAVRKAWNANREGDMFQSLGRAMDIVDPERNEQPIRAVEKHEHLSDRLRAAGFSETGEGDTVSRKWSGPE